MSKENKENTIPVREEREVPDVDLEISSDVKHNNVKIEGDPYKESENILKALLQKKGVELPNYLKKEGMELPNSLTKEGMELPKGLTEEKALEEIVLKTRSIGVKKK